MRDSITNRIDALSPRSTRVLSAAAVLGTVFDVESVAAMVDERPEQVLDGLVEIDEAGLATLSDSAGRVAFSHPLVRQIVYDGLPPATRASLHLQAGDVLARIGPGSAHVAAVAHHYGLATAVGGLDLALEHARRAGDHAAARLAFESAAQHFGDVLDLADRGATLDPGDRVEVMLRRAEALVSAGAMRDGRALFADAALAAEAIEDHDRLARGALGRAGYRGMPGAPDVDAIALLERSIAAPAPDPLLSAQVGARQAMELYYLGERGRRDQLSAEAVEAARRGDDGAVLAQVLVSRHYAVDEVANVEERTAVAAEAARLAEANGDADTAMRAHYLLVRDHLEVGNRLEADAAVGRLRDLAAEVREPVHAWRLRLLDALFAHLDADLEAAERHADEALALGAAAEIPNAAVSHLGMVFLVRAEQGRLGELVEPVRACHAAYPGYSTWGPMLAWALLEAGDRVAAKVTFDRVLAGFDDLAEDEAFLSTSFALANLAVAFDAASAAEAMLERYRPFADRVVVVAGPTGCGGPVALQLGRLAALLGRNEEGMAHLNTAAAVAGRLRSPLWRWHVAEARGAMPATASAHPAGLTDREVEVLRLVAAGLTNREVADRLCVGVRTVDSHVSTVYRKVGARRRVDAVSFAIANGLTLDP